MNRREFFRSAFAGVAATITAAIAGPSLAIAAFTPKSLEPDFDKIAYQRFTLKVQDILRHNMFEPNDQITRMSISKQVGSLINEHQKSGVFSNCTVSCGEGDTPTSIVLRIWLLKRGNTEWTELNFHTSYASIPWNEVKA